MQTISSFNTNDDRLKKFAKQRRQDPFDKFFSSSLPAEWGTGNVDPYTFSALDGIEKDEKKPSSGLDAATETAYGTTRKFKE